MKSPAATPEGPRRWPLLAAALVYAAFLAYLAVLAAMHVAGPRG